MDGDSGGATKRDSRPQEKRSASPGALGSSPEDRTASSESGPCPWGRPPA